MSKKQAKNGVKTLSLRLPQRVAKAVAKRAKDQNRSLNAQIVEELSFMSVDGFLVDPFKFPRTDSGTPFLDKPVTC